MNRRIANRFKQLKTEARSGLVTFTMMGDPDIETSYKILQGLPAAGADIIEIGAPFTDPMADGPIIQEAGQRALKAGITLHKIIELVRRFRNEDQDTPIILMGYYNPIYIYGVDIFIKDALEAGLDGLIVVDLPTEEDAELCIPAIRAGLDFIRLVAPTTNRERLSQVLSNSSGFVYYISITGITGTKGASSESICKAVRVVLDQTSLPVAVGFGIKTKQQAIEIAPVADAVVVGSALIQKIKDSLTIDGAATSTTISSVHSLVRNFSSGIRQCEPRSVS